MPQPCPFLGAFCGVWITIWLLVPNPPQPMSDLPCGHHITVILKIWGCGKCWAQKYILASSTLVISSGLVLSVYTHEISGRMPRISWMSLFLIPVSLKSFFFFSFFLGRLSEESPDLLKKRCCRRLCSQNVVQCFAWHDCRKDIAPSVISPYQQVIIATVFFCF